MVAIGFEKLEGVFRPGDIVYNQSKSIVSRLIRFFTRGRKEEPSWASHAAGVSQVVPDVLICEATAKGVQENPFVSLDKGTGHAVVLRWPGLSRSEQETIVKTWRSQIGWKYSFIDLTLHFLDSVFFKGKYRFRRLSWWEPSTCAAFVMQGYVEAGRGTPFAIDEITPDDLLDWQIRQMHQIVWASSPDAIESLRSVYGEIIAELAGMEGENACLSK